MKTGALILCLMFSISGSAGADRTAPREISPVLRGEIIYKVPHFGGQTGSIEARDRKTDNLIWRRQIYVIKYQPDMEQDVQECFITGMELKGAKLQIRNEMGFEYELDLLTLKVKIIKGTLVIFKKGGK